MLRLLDARSGAPADVRPTRTGLLRVCAYLPGGEPDVTGLRVLLVADLLPRVAEMGDLQVVTVLATDGQSPAHVADLTGRYGIHPPSAQVNRADIRAMSGGPVDVHLVSGDPSVTGTQGGLVVNVGAANMPQADDFDPLAVRYALLSFPYDQLAEATESVLAGAGETIGRWRTLVAGWAEMPSGAIPARVVEAAQAAWSDLDTVSVLTLLDDLAADDAVPAGARFESFLYADRILGLELAREIGRTPWTGFTVAGRDPI